MATEHIPIEKLRLDPENPRLPAFVERDPEAILSYLTSSAAVDELIDAIGENGYFEAEPLIGVSDGDVVIVIEGNRRLTALKLLSKHRESSPDEIDADTDLPSKIRTALKQAANHPVSVPVALHDHREDVLVYLGNKHIAGVKPWGALAKAKYVQQLMDQPQFSGPNFDENIRNVARSIGSRADYIKRALRALKAYNDARAMEYFGLPDLSEESVKFSRLSSALDYSDILNFVSANPEVEYPVEYDHERLAELFKWLFVENDDGNTIVGDTRNLRQLSDVLANEKALEAIRRGKSLASAYRMTSSLGLDFDNLLSAALESLQRANAIAPEIEATEPRLDDANALFKQSRALRTTLESN
jgi:hypothetical protein